MRWWIAACAATGNIAPVRADSREAAIEAAIEVTGADPTEGAWGAIVLDPEQVDELALDDGDGDGDEEDVDNDTFDDDDDTGEEDVGFGEDE